MDMDMTQQLAEQYADNARNIYDEFGELAPIIAFHGEQPVVVCSLPGTDDVPGAMAAAIAMIGAALRPDIVITVSEVWQRSYEADELGEAESIERGDLSRAAAAGDQRVGTALMVAAWCRQTSRCHAVIDRVVEPKVYDRTASHGPQEGAMAALIMRALDYALDAPALPDVPNELIFQLAQELGVVSAVAVQGKD